MKIVKAFKFISILFFILGTTFFLGSTTVMAQEGEEFKKFANHTVYYTVFNSTFISADIAKAYGIKRSKYESLINVVVSKNGEHGGIPVVISGTATNLMQQQKQLGFKTIEEEDTVYYIAPVRIGGEEVMHFDITVRVEDEPQPLKLKFTKKLYAE